MGCGGSKDDNTAQEPGTMKPSDTTASSGTTATSTAALVVDDKHFQAEIGFVIKSRKSDDAKVFINVFHHSSVLYIVSGDKGKFSSDRVGEQCLTYDVVINTAVNKICSTNDDARLYVSIVILHSKKYE